MNLKEYQGVKIIERDDEHNVDEIFYALYAGENLSDKYPDSYQFWLYIEWAKVWERQSYDKRVEYESFREDEKRRVVELIFTAKSWDIGS